MYSLFETLAKSSYWKMLLRRDTWREAGISLRRAHKDKRARKHLLGVGMLLLIPVLCLLYLAWLAGSGAILLVPFLIPVMLWRRRREKEDEVTLHIAPSSAPIEKKFSEDEQKALRSYLARLAIFYAVMVDRANSEGFLKEKFLPEGFEVTSRRIHIELLRKLDLWDSMASRDREAVMMPDGGWDWDLINQVVSSIEPVRLLRWMLRKDFYLPVIGQQLRTDWSCVRELIDAAEAFCDGTALIEIASVRTANESANSYFLRCWAEGVSRGYFTSADEEATEWARSVSDNLRGKESDDYVLSGKLVGEVSEAELRWATTLSYRRKAFLEWAIPVMEEAKIPEWRMSVFPMDDTAAAVEDTVESQAV